MASTQRNWYVMRTQPLMEERVAKDLNRAGVETLLPLAAIETRLRSGLLVNRIRPLFRSYLFVHVNWDTATRIAISNVRFIKGFLGYTDISDEPGIVREQDMEELRQRLSECGGVIPLNVSRSSKPLEAGDMIRVLFGPFRDHTAQVQAVHGSRVQFLIRLLNQDHMVKLPQECLAVAA